jgi:hypothetical protein
VTFSLVNLALLPLAVLVAVPVLIHLFARARPPEHKFSSVQFLRRVVRTTIRMRRPRDLLLLAVRTFAVAALVAVFLRPVVFADRRLAGGAGQRSVVVVVDASASMAYMEAAQTRFAQACANASERLSAMRPGDMANVIWMRARAEPVFPEAGPNIGALQDALRRKRVTAEPADVDGAIRMAFDMLKGAPGRREICLISDFQATVWGDRTFSAPPGVALVAVRVGRADGANRAVVRMDVTPPVALAGENVSVGCEVANFDPVARRTTVYLGAGESRQKQEVMLPAWGRASVSFQVRFKAAGRQTVNAWVDEDSFPADDQRWLVLEVRDRLRVGVLSAGAGTAERWRDALEAFGWAQVGVVGQEELGRVLDVDALLLEGWDGAGAKGVDVLLEGGGPVVWMPAAGMPLSRLHDARRGSGAAPEGGGLVAAEQGGAEHRLRVAMPDDPLFGVFASGENGDPARGRFRARLAVPAAALPGASILLAYDDGVPALARMDVRRPLWFWNLNLSSDASDWARQPEFVAVLGEILVGAWAGQGRDRGPDLVPGDRLSLSTGREAIKTDISLDDEGGNPMPLSSNGSSDGMVLVSDPVASPGLYTWRNRAERIGVSAVNFAVVESDLRACPPRSVERMGFAVADAGSKVTRLHEGVQIWPAILGIAALLLVLEAGLVMWAGRSA